MTVTDVRKDTTALCLAITSEYDAPADRVWRLWADPRLLERWWGPPSHPATVIEHDLVAGGRVTYYMTGPDGDRYHGWWMVQSVDPPRELVFQDGFADPDGNPNPDMPTTIGRVTLGDRDGGGTVMTIESTFPSLESMEQLVAMGMQEGIQQALGQTDALLAEPGVAHMSSAS
jgi:uncharacterized protein YndB with AHSA1/START domain